MFIGGKLTVYTLYCNTATKRSDLEICDIDFYEITYVYLEMEAGAFQKSIISRTLSFECVICGTM